MIVPGKVALMVMLAGGALGFMIALARSPSVDVTRSNVLLVVTDNIVVTLDPVGNAQ